MKKQTNAKIAVMLHNTEKLETLSSIIRVRAFLFRLVVQKMLNAWFMWRTNMVWSGGKNLQGTCTCNRHISPNYWLENMERESFLSFIGLCSDARIFQNEILTP